MAAPMGAPIKVGNIVQDYPMFPRCVVIHTKKDKRETMFTRQRFEALI
jgi:hypothetical protein